MRIRLHRSLLLTALFLTLSPLHCRAVDPPLNQIPVESLNQSLSDQDLQQWYHLSAGTQLIPYDWLVALVDDSLTKRLNGFEVALAQAQQSDHALDDVRGAHALRNRDLRVDHRFHLRQLAALPDQGQTGVRGQMQFAGLLDFKAWHGCLGECVNGSIISCN